MTSYGPPNVSNKIADYATPEEIEPMVVALRKRLRQYEVLDDVSGDAKRRSIKRALRAIRKGKVPFAWDERFGATDILAPILTQFDAAFEEVYKQAPNPPRLVRREGARAGLARSTRISQGSSRNASKRSTECPLRRRTC